MEGIKKEQKPIETDAGKDYPEPNVIPKEAEDLIKECKTLAGDARNIGKQIEKTRKGPSKELGKDLSGPIGGSLLDLDQRIFKLAQKLENLGHKLWENGEALRDKEKFTPELKSKFDKQGKLLENIGRKLQNIGNNFEHIGDRMNSIGKRITGDEGTKITDFAEQIRDLSNRVKDKGAQVEQLGIQIQKLEPNVRDTTLDKDLEDMQKALGEIGNDLEAIAKVSS